MCVCERERETQVSDKEPIKVCFCEREIVGALVTWAIYTQGQLLL